ncbi:NYN domain-containing protein [Glycomyces sp. NPDC048151]|uniref:NYN domain-containing protein n=1 Tax=Glycomyces sp. NPDC048151 TaxID=3364002 RepID=UPI003724A861
MVQNSPEEAMSQAAASQPVLFVYVDNSNLWIEGQRLSAVKKGLATDVNDATKRKTFDNTWRCDFGQLYKIACPDNARIGRSKLWGSRPPDDDSVWNMAKKEGFQVEVFDRNAGNKEKKVDTAITAFMIDDLHEFMKPDRGDIAVLVGGDGDFVPAFEILKNKGISVEIVFWEHGLSKELRDKADRHVSLNPHFELLSRVS